MRMNSDSEGSIYADLVSVELWQMFRKEYWSRLWIIQETGGQPHHLDGILGRVRVPVIETLEGTEAGIGPLGIHYSMEGTKD